MYSRVGAGLLALEGGGRRRAGGLGRLGLLAHRHRHGISTGWSTGWSTAAATVTVTAIAISIAIAITSSTAITTAITTAIATTITTVMFSAFIMTTDSVITDGYVGLRIVRDDSDRVMQSG